MRAFIILGFLVAASTAGRLGYDYAPAPVKTVNLVGSGSSFVDTVGLAGTGHHHGHELIGSGSGLVGNRYGNYYGNELIGSGSGLVGTRYGSGLIRSGSGIIGTGNRGLISSLGYGNGLIGFDSLTNNYGNNRVISTGGLINGGSQIISGGNRLIGGGTKVIGIPSLDSIPQTVEYSKQFFHFDAPEERQEEGIITKELSNVLKKNLQVVFIKAPENNAATNAALQLAKQAIEQKTDIYVLSKQNDGAQLVGQIQQIQENVPTVPDVRIVKYRTPQDLAYAKEVIQNQYENTGGSSQSFDGGVAPVLNYASGVSSLSTGGAILGSNLGSSNIIRGGTVLGSGLGTTTLVDNGSLLRSGIGSGLGTTTLVDNGSLLRSGIGSTNIIGTRPLLGSGITTTKIINSSPLISSGNYALGTNRVSTVSLPQSSQYLPPLKKK